jgi:natural product precursor
MKTKKLKFKLPLNKKTIANLSSSEMNRELGGYPTDYCTPACTMIGPECNFTKRDCAITETCAYATAVCCSVAEC